MRPAVRRLLKQVSSGIVKNREQVLAVRQEFGETLEAADEREVAALADDFAKAGKWNTRAPTVVALLAALVVLLWQSGSLRDAALALRAAGRVELSFFGPIRGSGNPLAVLSGRMAPEDVKFVFADREWIGNPDPDEWREHLESPDAYLRFAKLRLERNGELPEDFLEVGNRIDPGNGLFDLMAAMMYLELALKRPTADRALHKVQAIGLLGRAAANPKLDNRAKKELLELMAAMHLDLYTADRAAHETRAIELLETAAAKPVLDNRSKNELLKLIAAMKYTAERTPTRPGRSNCWKRRPPNRSWTIAPTSFWRSGSPCCHPRRI